MKLFFYISTVWGCGLRIEFVRSSGARRDSWPLLRQDIFIGIENVREGLNIPMRGFPLFCIWQTRPETVGCTMMYRRTAHLCMYFCRDFVMAFQESVGVPNNWQNLTLPQYLRVSQQSIWL